MERNLLDPIFNRRRNETIKAILEALHTFYQEGGAASSSLTPAVYTLAAAVSVLSAYKIYKTCKKCNSSSFHNSPNGDMELQQISAPRVNSNSPLNRGDNNSHGRSHYCKRLLNQPSEQIYINIDKSLPNSPVQHNSEASDLEKGPFLPLQKLRDVKNWLVKSEAEAPIYENVPVRQNPNASDVEKGPPLPPKKTFGEQDWSRRADSRSLPLKDQECLNGFIGQKTITKQERLKLFMDEDPNIPSCRGTQLGNSNLGVNRIILDKDSIRSRSGELF